MSQASFKEVQSMREAIRKIASIITRDKNIRVTQQGIQAFVENDKRTGEVIRVNVPSIPEVCDRKFLVSIQGFLDHELGHVLFTDFQATLAALQEGQSMAVMNNIVEDVFVERQMTKRYLGSRRNLRDMYEIFTSALVGKRIRELQAKSPNGQLTEQQWMENLLPTIVRAYGGQRHFQDYMKDLWQHVPNIKKALDEINLSSLLDGIRSSMDSLEVARKLVKALTDPNEPQGGCEQESQSSDAGGGGGKGQPEEGESDDQSDDGQGESDGPGASGDTADGSEESEDDGDANGGQGDQAQDEDEDGDEGGAGGGAGDDEEEEGAGEDESDEGAGGEDEDDQSAGDEDGGDSAGEDEGEEEEDQQGAGDSPKDASSDDGEDSAGEDEGDEDSAGEDEGDEDSAGEDEDDAGDAEEGDAGDESESEDDGDESESEDDGTDDGGGGEDHGDQEDMSDPASGNHPENGVGAGMKLEGDNIEIEDFDDLMAEIIAEKAEEAHDASDYTVFTRDYDWVDKLPLEDPSEEIVEKIADEVKDMVGPMQRALQRAIVAKNKVRRIPGKRSGRIKASNLHRLMSNDDRIFYKKEETKTRNVAISLVVDCSGSMAGGRSITAAIAATALAEVLDRLGVSFEALGFTTGHYKDDHTKMQRAMREEQDRRGKHRGYNRTVPLVIPIFKDFNESFTNVARARIAHSTESGMLFGANVDGESLEVAATRLLKQPTDAHMMIVLSDGQPAGAHNAGGHLKRVVKELTDRGVNMVGIGIQSAAVRSYYPKSSVLQDISDLPTVVIAEVRDALLKK